MWWFILITYVLIVMALHSTRATKYITNIVGAPLHIVVGVIVFTFITIINMVYVLCKKK